MARLPYKSHLLISFTHRHLLCPSPTAMLGEQRKARVCCMPAAACGRDKQQPLQPMAAVSASLRAIKAKRELTAARRGVPQAAVTTNVARCAGRGAGHDSWGTTGAAHDAGDAMAWVFCKVYFDLPERTVGLLGIVASCLGTAVEMETERTRAKEAKAKASKAEPDGHDDDEGDTGCADYLPELVGLDVEKELLARIGILHGDEGMPLGVSEDEQEAINLARAGCRKAPYETIIATTEANSLISPLCAAPIRVQQGSRQHKNRASPVWVCTNSLYTNYVFVGGA